MICENCHLKSPALCRRLEVDGEILFVAKKEGVCYSCKKKIMTNAGLEIARPTKKPRFKSK